MTLILALVPPSVVGAALGSAVRPAFLAWYDFCSMFIGAAPFITAGAVAAAVLGRTNLGSRRTRWLVPVVAMLFCGCDCALSGFCDALRRAHPRLTAFATVWASCCNPIALSCTAAILGTRLVESRMIAGAIAAALGACMWRPGRVTDEHSSCNVASAAYSRQVVRAAGMGFASFVFAAAISALVLVCNHAQPLLSRPLAAAAFGALVSPCSTSDAILARILTSDPACQVAFIVSGQCLDIRQLALTQRLFGTAHALGAAAATVPAIVIGCLWARHAS